MERVLLPSDILLNDSRLLRLGFDELTDGASYSTFFERARFDVDAALSILKGDPDLGARFLGLAPGNGTILWNGEYSSERLAGYSLGVKVVHRRSGEEVVGDNRFGNFLGLLRDRYREYLKGATIEEVPVSPGQVIVDFTPKGAYQSDIEAREQAGEEFIHVDVYRPARFRFDASRDGTTGHASRRSDEEVSFQRFVCPFGTSYPSPLIVGSAAEASFLYERALRGELDWKALFDNLSQRGLMKRELSARQKETLAREYSAQFAWMREQIATDGSLRDKPIVASSLLVPDSSLGRSIYNPETAPSPAHVLARYINNPILLQMPSENGVFRSMSLEEKSEPEKFILDEGEVEVLNLAVVGSDTIGGREPGRKATSTNVRQEMKDKDGRRIITTSKKYTIPQKTREETEADYARFSERMDAILSGVPEGVRVRLWTGNSSGMSDSVGVGTPRMIERYVREKGGMVGQWNYFADRVDGHSSAAQSSGEAPSRLEAVLMEHFAEVLPVLSGKERSVTFLMDAANPESEVLFSGSPERSADGAVCFSASDDTNNRNVLAMGSFVAGECLPVIHVMENATEQEQRQALRSGVVLSLASLSGEVSERGTLFAGEQRDGWTLSESDVLSYIDPDTQLAIPFVFNTYPSAVVVAGYEFHSAFGTYAALAAQELGVADRSTLLSIVRAENTVTELRGVYDGILSGRGPLSGEVEEKLLRQATRLMCDSNRPFAERLLDLDGTREIVMPVNGDDPTGLFVDLDGRGLNRFGMVLSSERVRMKDLLQARLDEQMRERELSVQEAARRQKVAVGARAEGQKVATGLPRSLSGAEGAVWFLGTNTPDQLVLPDEAHSFDMWDDMDGDDVLVREKAARPWVEDGEGGRLDNTFVFLFPSDLAAVTGRRRPSNKPDSRDLTGVTRVDPKTGKEFVAAVGIPVRFNNRGNELSNPDNFPCSYRLDNDASNYAESLVLADSQARSTAYSHGMTLCLPGRHRIDGSTYYTLAQVFMEKSWNAKEKKWDVNPHRSRLNEALTKRYIDLLERGESYPLNCVPLPAASYREEDLPAVVDEAESTRSRYISAEGRFVSDLLLALRIANSTALALGVPLRFPLDKDGHIDLGPGVPEKFRELAERKIDSFIGVVKEEDIADGVLPSLDRISMYEASKSRGAMSKAGTDLYLRPNDLVFAFGQYDFRSILAGQPAPLHEMAFRMDDAVFTLVDAKFSTGVDPDDINGYLAYSKNDERRFMIRTTDVEKVPEFLSVLKAYIERAKSVRVEARLVRETELKGSTQGLKGFVNLLSSNSERFAESEHDIGREATVFNASGVVSKDGGLSSRNIDGNEVEGIYWGHVDARDGFAGYAQVRCLLPDGRQSGWMTVEDLELAKDMVMSMVGRSYRGDDRVVPSESVLKMLMVAYSMEYAGEKLRTMSFEQRKPVAVDDKVVHLDEEPAAGAAPVPDAAPSLDGAGSATKPSQREGREFEEIGYTVSEGGYSKRTWENANADDVDFTLAFATDFSTWGERCTAKAAGDSIIQVGLPVKKDGGIDLSAKAVKNAADTVADSLPEEFLSGEPFGLNVAGNGLYTLAAEGVTQQQADEFVVRVLASLQKRGVVLSSLRSGGQTGIDEAGAAAGRALGIPTTVHAPKNWLFRGADGKDVQGEAAFKARFEKKNYIRLADCAKGRRRDSIDQTL